MSYSIQKLSEEVPVTVLSVTDDHAAAYGGDHESIVLHVDERRALIDYVAEALDELRFEWQVNHRHHCRDEWPHTGVCEWEMPPVLRVSPQGVPDYVPSPRERS